MKDRKVIDWEKHDLAWERLLAELELMGRAWAGSRENVLKVLAGANSLVEAADDADGRGKESEGAGEVDV